MLYGSLEDSQVRMLASTKTICTVAEDYNIMLFSPRNRKFFVDPYECAEAGEKTEALGAVVTWVENDSQIRQLIGDKCEKEQRSGT